MAEGDFNIKAIISADSSKFDRGIKNVGNSVKNTSNQIDALTSKMKTAFTALGGLFAINKIKNFSSESVKAWKYQEKQLKLLSSTLKVTGASAWTSSKEITAFASSLQKVTNYSDETIISMQNVLLGFKNIKGDNFKEATKAILDMSTVMGMDLTSSAQAVGKALDDPIKGINSLTRQGFYFTDSQKKLLAELVRTGKQAEAQKIILKELATTYGGASQATADISEQLKNTWGDLKEQIGGAIAEITNKFAGFLKDVVEGIQNMSAHTKTFISAFAKTALALGGLTTAVYVFKTALDALKAHPIILAISLAISGVSALIGLFSTANHELEDEAEDIKNLNEASKALFSTSDKEKKLTAQQVKELTTLYPELTGKIKANNTTVEKAMELQKELHRQKTLTLFHKQEEELKKLDNTYKELTKDLDNYKKESENVYSSEAQMRENKGAIARHTGELQSQLKEQKQKIDAQIIAINASLESIGYRLDTKTRKLVEIEVEVNEDSLNNSTNEIKKEAKSWKEFLAKALDVSEFKFDKGKDAVELYKKELVEKLKEGEEVAKALGIPFEKTDFLEARLSEIREKIIELLGIDPDEIDSPFELEELEKENTALYEMVALYKELKGQAIDSQIADLKKEVDNLRLSEDELYLSQLRVKGATEEQIAEARKLLKLKKDIADSQEQEQRDYEIIRSYAEKILNKRIGAEKKWTKEKEKQSYERLDTERKEELSNARSAEAKAKINEYYDMEEAELAKQIAADKKKERNKALQQWWASIKNAVKGFETFGRVAKKIVSGVITLFKNTFNAVKNFTKSMGKTFTNLIEFDISETLDKVLEYEDKVLTFFASGFSKMPGFFKSLFESISKTLGSVISVFDLSDISKILSEILNTIVENVDTLLPKFLGLVEGILISIGDFIVNNSDLIVSTIGKIIMSIVRVLPTIIPKLVDVIASLISSIADFILNNGDEFENLISKTVEGIITSFAEFLKNGGFKKLIRALLTIQKMLQNVIVENIDELVDVIVDALPDLIEGLVESIVSASEALQKIAKPLIKLIVELFKAIIKIATDQRVIDASIETIGVLIEEIISAIIENLPVILGALIKGIMRIVANIPKLIVRIFKAIYKGFYKGLANKQTWANIGKMFVDIWDGILDTVKIVGNFFAGLAKGFKDGIKWIWDKIKGFFSWLWDKICGFFGVHSPSTLFAGLGKNMILGLWEGIKSLGSWLWDMLSGFFSWIWDGIKNVFSGVGSWFSKTFSSAWDGIKDVWDSASDWFEDNVWTPIKNGATTVCNWIEKAFSKVGSWLSDVWDGMKNIGSSIASGVSTAVDKVKDGVSSAVSKAKDVVSNIGSSIASGVSSGISKVKDVASDVGSAIVSGVKKLKFWATGTQSAPRGLAVVGEQGPELVRFRGGEQVVNNSNTNKLLSGMNGNTNNFSVTFNNMKDTSVFTLMSQLRQYNRQMAVNGII